MSFKLSKMLITIVVIGLLSGYANANIADDLTANYNKIVDNCGSPGRPSFLCSGVIIRAAKGSTNYHIWDPSPSSINQGGVSFSYLRKDAKMGQFVFDYNNGFIVYPSSLKPQGKKRLEVLCSFPIDGWSDQRIDKRCGMIRGTVQSSKPCQQQDITTGEQWFLHYSSHGGMAGQCGFNVAIGTANSAAAFNASIQGQILLRNNSTVGTPFQNELVVATWETDTTGKSVNPEQLPIQAFFYTNEAGLKFAQYYQRDYYKTTFIGVPIVKVTIPTDLTQDVKFEYFKEDQQQICMEIIND